MFEKITKEEIFKLDKTYDYKYKNILIKKGKNYYTLWVYQVKWLLQTEKFTYDEMWELWR